MYSQYGAVPAADPAVAPGGSWDALERDARKAEGALDDLLLAYARKGGDPGASIQLERQIEDQLQKLTAAVGELARLQDLGPAHAGAILQRHRDLLFEHGREFRKGQTTASAARERSELLLNVGDGGAGRHNGGGGAGELLMAERGRIDDAHRMTDDVLAQAYGAREALGEQRSVLFRSGSTVSQISARFPLIQNVLQSINSRRRRETLILAGVISLCLVLFLWFLFG